MLRFLMSYVKKNVYKLLSNKDNSLERLGQLKRKLGWGMSVDESSSSDNISDKSGLASVVRV